MAIRILTKNGTENTNIDGARDNNFNAGRRSGIVKGVLNEGNLYGTGNTLVLEPCELRLCGHRVVIDENENKVFTNRPQTATKQSLVAQIKVNGSEDVKFELLVQNSSTTLVQDNLDVNGTGIYQIEIGTFVQNTDGTIGEIVKTADVITNITREQLNEVVSNSTNAINNSATALTTAQTALNTANTAKTTADSSLTKSNTALENANEALGRVVEGLGTKVSIGGVTQSTVSFTSNPQTQLDSKANQSALDSTNTLVSNNAGNITSLNNNKANKDLSNVTYPQVVADGVAKRGAGDRVVERKVSTDGYTWYEIYESGWKRCGLRTNATTSWVNKTLPITFSNTSYTITVTKNNTTENIGASVVSNNQVDVKATINIDAPNVHITCEGF